MGQRLIIKNYINSELVNNIYYHWSAYTDSAAQEVQELADSLQTFYDEYKDSLPPLLKDEILDLDEFKKQNPIDFFNIGCQEAISGVSSTAEESIEYINKFFKPDVEVVATNRNAGLIAYTEDDMENNLSWSEGTLYIWWVLDENGDIDWGQTTVDMIELSYTEYPEEIDDDYKPIAKNFTYNESSTSPLDDIPIVGIYDYVRELPNSWGDDDLIYNKIE